MNKKALMALALLPLLTGALASCEPDPNDEEKIVASIAIKENSQPTSYYIGQIPDYSDLKIDLLNAKKAILTTLPYVGNESKITHSDIDTSTIGKDKIFTVTYKDAGKTFECTMTYEVTELQYELNNWSRNAEYLKTVEASVNPKLSESETALESGFLKAIDYVIGNDNGVSLLPVIYATTLDDEGKTVKLDKMPNGVEVALTKKGETTKLVLSEYLDENALLSSGTVHFKNSVTGSYSLTLSHSDLDTTIVYDLEVVDGYNAISASDLFALSSARVGGSDYVSQTEADGILAYKKEHGLSETVSANLVLQNDIAIGRKDIPSVFIWGDEAVSESVKGSFKDWTGLIHHTFVEEGTATVYGNGHTLSLKEATKADDGTVNEDAFPWAVTDSHSGAAQEEGKPISSHSSVFFASYAKDVDPANCTLRFQDLLTTGNMGVSAQTKITEAGPMFSKAYCNISLDNVNVSKFYMAAMGSGSNEKTVEGGKTYISAPHVSISNSRLRDTFNSAIYLWARGSIDIEKSELIKSGGPLLFLNPFPFVLPYEDLSKLSTTPKMRVNLDEESYLSSLTEGKGGWFSVYRGAEAISGALKNMDAALFNPLGMSFLRKDNSGASPVDKFNFWMVSLPQNEEGITLPDSDKGGVDVEVSQGGKILFSTIEGLSKTLKAGMAYKQNQSDENLDAYLNALSDTAYGNGLVFASAKKGMTWRTLDAEGKGHYAITNTNLSDGSYFLCDSLYAIKTALGAASSSDSYTPNASFLREGTLGVTINDEKGRPGDATNPTSFKGVCNYGVLLGGYHSTKA